MRTVGSYLLDHAAALIAAGTALWSALKLQRVHVQINSRMDKWIEEVRTGSHAEGYKAGEQAERDRGERGIGPKEPL